MTSAWRQQKKLHGYTSTERLDDVAVHFLKPTTYMNSSGIAVRATLDYHHIHPDELIVVHDEVDIPFAETRKKFGGGTAGHNGLKSIIEHIGTENFWRVRIGVGRPQNPHRPLADFVLDRWTEKETTKLDGIVERAIDAVQTIIRAL